MAGKKTGWETYDLKGKVREWVEIDYHVKNNDGVIIKEITQKTIYKYNENGKMIDKTRYDKNGVLFDKYIPKCDDNGNAIERATYDEKGTLSYFKTSSYTYY